MTAIEEMRKVIEPGINYISLLKAQMTKYKSKKMVGGKWVYEYDDVKQIKKNKLPRKSFELKKITTQESIDKGFLNKRGSLTNEGIKNFYESNFGFNILPTKGVSEKQSDYADSIKLFNLGEATKYISSLKSEYDGFIEDLNEGEIDLTDKQDKKFFDKLSDIIPYNLDKIKKYVENTDARDILDKADIARMGEYGGIFNKEDTKNSAFGILIP